MSVGRELLAAAAGAGGCDPSSSREGFFLPIPAVWMGLLQLLGQQSVAEGSGGDALKAGSASLCSWWLCWPVTRGTEAAASPRFGPGYRTRRAP